MDGFPLITLAVLVLLTWLAQRFAEIDAAKIVWAREIPGRDLKPLLDYYRDRQICLVNADAAHPQIEPYHSDATAQSSH